MVIMNILNSVVHIFIYPQIHMQSCMHANVCVSSQCFQAQEEETLVCSWIWWGTTQVAISSGAGLQHYPVSSSSAAIPSLLTPGCGCLTGATGLPLAGELWWGVEGLAAGSLTKQG